MKKVFYFCEGFIVLFFLFGFQTNAQTAFTNSNNRLSTAAHSGCSVTVVDWNGDGMDDIVRLDQGHIVTVEIQRTNQQYEHRVLGDFGGGQGWAWGMCVADIDHNGYKDIVAGGYSTGKVLMVNSTGNGGTITTLASSGFFWQNITFADFNNDGWIDVFACDDDAAAHLYLNDGTGNILPSTFVDFAVNPGINYGGDPADSGNYGSAWIDFDNDGDLDLFVAHCRQSTSSPSDLRRKDRLFVNNGSNSFTDQSSAFGIEATTFNQTWTASFGDIDNDGDLDLMVTNHDVPSQILQNDGTGHYSDITASTGFNISSITPIESVMEDFDNDGYLDILVAGSDARFYHNNGNGTFTSIGSLFNTGMESFAIGDMNHDGFIDVYAGYGNIYTDPTNVDDILWLNNKNANHFFTLNLKGTISNHGAIGARAMVYGAPWGVQLREVRAGESYGTVNSSQLHFGLGSATTIDSVVIWWPSGIHQTIVNPVTDQFLTVIENDCVAPVATISASGPLVICPGQTLTLSAPAGYNYLWSDGSITQSISVSAAGDYGFQMSSAGSNCIAVSPTVTVVSNPNQTPVITAAGETEICNGSSVVLNGPSGFSSYLWSNGDTTQSISATQNGNYTLTIQGICQPWTSLPINVIVHTPVLPSANDVTLSSPGSTTLTALTGNNISWYASSSGGSPLATGNTFNTPVLNDTTIYYMESSESYGGSLNSVGLASQTGTSQYSTAGTTNATMIFDVLDNCILQSVKVYTDTPGDRLFELRDNGGALINSLLVTVVPDTQVVTLNFPLTPGAGYTLGTDANTNLQIPGWNQDGPRFKRSSSNNNYAYPFTVNGILSITGNSIGLTYFYYFYDWKIAQAPLVCTSPLVPVTVFVTSPTGINTIENSGISIYPNPASSKLTIETGQLSNLNVSVYDLSSRLVLTKKLEAVKSVLDISSLAKGVYHLKMEADGKSYFSKLIIE